MKKVTNNVYAETGIRGCNPSFVVTKEGVVMIDTPQMPADAIKWRDEIAKHGKVRYLINTEPHGDHFTGNYFFEGTVVAHEGTRDAILAASVEQLKERLKQTAPDSLPLMKDFKYRPPNITFSQRLTLHLGNHTFQLINLPGHTPYQVAIYVPEERVVFTADNVVCRVQAYLHQAVPYEWLNSLKRIQEIDADILVPGHGNICDRSYIPEMSAFIQAWIDAVKAAINQGMSLEEAQEKVSLLDRYPMQAGSEAMGQQVQRMNIARLYKVLKD
ncbi:MAG: MBL fold metallo-hydrolase [Dehalococcoidales bacterium]|nr:MBL fold metallo-hydrolase [Dehalococcoidales bacterium]